MKWCLEIVQDFNYLYYANMTMGGKDISGVYHKPHPIHGLAEYVNYRTLAESIERVTGVKIPNCNNLYWIKNGRKQYAIIDATQHRPGKDCRVSREDIAAGWKPNFS